MTETYNGPKEKTLANAKSFPFIKMYLSAPVVTRHSVFNLLLKQSMTLREIFKKVHSFCLQLLRRCWISSLTVSMIVLFVASENPCVL